MGYSPMSLALSSSETAHLSLEGKPAEAVVVTSSHSKSDLQHRKCVQQDRQRVTLEGSHA